MLSRFPFVFLIPFAFVGNSAPLVAEETATARSEPLIREARGLIKSYAGQLKAALAQAIKTDGPIAAIEVCSHKSPQIAHNLSEKSAWTIGRTSLKLRNPASAPDDWERAVLQDFEKRRRAGEDPKTIDHAEWGADGTFRYMKAIPTQEMCLACHGANLRPDVRRQLAEYYPEDQATGYDIGMIRGAFTLRRGISPQAKE